MAEIIQPSFMLAKKLLNSEKKILHKRRIIETLIGP
jgi:hypothetical protein